MNDEAATSRPVASPRAAPRLRAWHKALLAVAGVLAILFLFVWLVLPGIVRRQAERLGSESLHRPLHIEAVRIHPWSLDVAVLGARLMEPDDRTVFVSWDLLEARLSLSSLVHLAPVVAQIRLVGPRAHWVRLGPGRYNTDDLVAALTPAGTQPTPPAAGVPRFAVHNIRVEQGQFEFDDEWKHAHHALSGFTLGVPFVSTFVADEEVFVKPLLRTVADGTPIELQGELRPFAPVPEATLDVHFDDFDLTQLAGYLPEESGLRLDSGRLSVDLKVAARRPAGGVPTLGLSGALGLRALEAKVPQARTPIRFSSIELQIARAELPEGPLDASLTIDGRSRIGVQGTAALRPLRAALAVAVENFDLLPFQPLVAERINLRVLRAGLGVSGRLQLEQAPGGDLQLAWQGDLALPGLATIDAVNGKDFVSWDALQLRGIDFHLQPMSLKVDEVTLDRLYARVIVSADGRLNLQDIVKSRVEARRSLTEATAAPPAQAAAPAPPAGEAAATAVAAVPAPSPPASTPAGRALPPVAIGKIAVRSGHVRYTDNFIQPHYTADLLNLNGTVAGLSSRSGTTAKVDVKGEVNGAPLLIAGAVNPLLPTATLDIEGSVHDMELAGLSPYSGKYVGYRIERGKLSFDVEYHLAQRTLQAQNHLVLNQLSFGERVESASATSLPVRFAIALLQDRNGVIDINLPIGGSLDDPQFSVGGLILKVLVNLVTKAVTAPFALLGNLFGGGQELSSAEFAPGQALVAPSVQERLAALAKALRERPGLQLDISGRVDPVNDRQALQRAKVDALLRSLKRQDLARGTASGGEVTVTPEEYPMLLARAYQASIAAQPLPLQPAAQPPGSAPPGAAAAGPMENPPPRKATSPPAKPSAPTQQQMEDLLRSRQTISDDELLDLGNSRAQAAKDWLLTQGQIAEQRMALVAAKISQAKEGGAQAPASGVEFALR